MILGSHENSATTRWSLLFIFGFLYWSIQQRYIVHLCTNRLNWHFFQNHWPCVCFHAASVCASICKVNVIRNFWAALFLLTPLKSNPNSKATKTIFIAILVIIFTLTIITMLMIRVIIIIIPTRSSFPRARPTDGGKTETRRNLATSFFLPQSWRWTLSSYIYDNCNHQHHHHICNHCNHQHHHKDRLLLPQCWWWPSSSFFILSSLCYGQCLCHHCHHYHHHCHHCRINLLQVSWWQPSQPYSINASVVNPLHWNQFWYFRANLLRSRGNRVSDGEEVWSIIC